MAYDDDVMHDEEDAVAEKDDLLGVVPLVDEYGEPIESDAEEDPEAHGFRIEDDF